MKVIANGPVNLPYYNIWSQKMKSHNYNEKLFSGFGVQKDVGLIAQAAEQLGYGFVLKFPRFEFLQF